MNDHPSCEQVQQQLAASLPERRAAAPALQPHLERCSRCAREWSGLLDLSLALEDSSEPSLEEIADARLGLRRQLAREPGPGEVAAAGLADWRTLTRPLLVRAAAFLVTLGLLVPIASSVSPLDSAATESDRQGAAIDDETAVDEVWRSVRQRAGELEGWTPRLGLESWFGMIPGRSKGMLPELPEIPSTMPSRSG